MILGEGFLGFSSHLFNNNPGNLTRMVNEEWVVEEILFELEGLSPQWIIGWERNERTGEGKIEEHLESAKKQERIR